MLFFKAIVPESCSGQLAKAAPQSGSPKLLPKAVLQSTSSKRLPQAAMPAMPTTCSPKLVSKAAPESCSPNEVLQSCRAKLLLKAPPKLLPKAVPLRCSQSCAQSCSPKLLPQSCDSSNLSLKHLPKLFCKAAPESCSRKLLLKAAPRSVCVQADRNSSSNKLRTGRYRLRLAIPGAHSEQPCGLHRGHRHRVNMTKCVAVWKYATGLLCNFIPLAWRAYISGLFPMQSQQHQRDTRTHNQQAWNICGPYREFKRATVACGKFKITETQTKVPKVCIREKSQMGKLGSGWKSQNSGRFLGKLARVLKCQNCGELPRETHAQTQLKDLPSDTGPGGIEPPTDPDRPYCICLVGHWLGRREIFPKKYHFFGKIILIFPNSSKISTSEQGLRKHRLSLYSRRLSLYSPIFPKK